MISMNKAEEIALTFINEEFDLSELDDRVILLKEETVENERGWIFYYNSENFVSTQDPSFMLMGNNPVFVNKVSGQALYIRGDIEVLEALAEI
jgi:Immunity protein 35